jgi:ribulose-5-phosphate 4-epimerase/fuculose-1-phosphate aldolase
MSPSSATSESSASDVMAPSAAMQGLEFPGPPTFTDKYKEREYQKGRLALAFRLFAKYGFDEGVAGHITLRDPVEPSSFWVNPMGVVWPTLKASDLILVNSEGEVVGGGEVRLLNTAAYMIHHAVHSVRPDVNAVAYSHSIYGRAFSTLGRSLDIITQDSCAFHNDVALYASFRGIVLGADEGIAVAKALGAKKAAILQNHGLL